jgi:hypothetical protein
VLSVVWLIGVVLWTLDEWGETRRSIDTLYFKCIFQPNTDPKLCDATVGTLREAASLEPWWGTVPWWALALISIAWLLVWGLVALVRWWRGFQPSA